MDGWFTSWRSCATNSSASKVEELTPATLTGAEGATSIKDEIAARMSDIKNAAAYRKVRYMLTTELGGATAVGDELTFSGFINTATMTLTVDDKPFNIFARLAASVEVQMGMEKEQLALGNYSDKFLICRNKPENDLYWDTQDPAWIGKVSMARRHRFLTTKNLHWEWFNALVFGLVPSEMGGGGLHRALAEVEAMKAAALTYVSNSPGWSKSVGLYFNIFGHNNVNSLFLHILDLTSVGPSFEYQAYKSCPLDAVLKVLKEEVEQHAALSPRSRIAIQQAPPSPTTRRQAIGGGAFFFAGTDGATSVKAEIVGRIPVLRDASSFREARRLLQDLGGPEALKEELSRAGLVDRLTGGLTTSTRPFNVFARLAAGAMKQPGLELDQLALGHLQERYQICSNLPENDDHWDSDDPAWIGKASMARRHRFMTFKNLHWSWFNALVFGLIPPEEGGVTLAEAIGEVEQMKEAALLYTSKMEGWSKNIGLFYHVFGHCSVNSLHMHILDMEEVGPTYHKLAYKNCPVDAILKVLKEEFSSSSSVLLARVSESAQAAAQAAQAATKAVSLVVGGAHVVHVPLHAAGGRKLDVLDLDVGGVTIAVETDTLLQCPEGSVLHSLGVPGKAAEFKRDMHGMIFLEYPPRPFGRIVDHLRILRHLPAGERALPPAPMGYERDEVLELADVLGVGDLFKGLDTGLRARLCGTRRYRPLRDA